ncbi:complex I assembly factor ACAD9, mitochondrial-like isoform X1 [Tachypleus tridentatus]|uniref:complex I assembly factor ACAD9, mitochondrial-like isoform X1 n=1 Tax=Tachypleus tridentatus TaxID=6853 RepID=UPI003FD2BBCA
MTLRKAAFLLRSSPFGLSVSKVVRHVSPENCGWLQMLRFFADSSQVSEQLKGEDRQEALKPQQTPKIKRPPFAKNLFLGIFDKEILTFPEVLNKEELTDLNRMVDVVEKYFKEKVDSKKIDIEAVIPEEILQGLKDMGLFGQQIPVEYGGLGLNATEFARLAEITSLDGAIAVTLAAHQSIGLKGILISGNEKQKTKYLPKLATGEHIAAFCLTEPGSGSDAASIQTKATLSEDGKTFYLTGEKIWISNGGIADVFTVFAKTEHLNERQEKVESISAFIVERKFGGITSGKPEDKMGIRGSNTCSVHFDNTPVPVENVLGKVGEGFKVAMNILNSGRFSMGSSAAGFLKELLGVTVEHAINRVQFKKPLTDFHMIQEKIAKITCNIYAVESMAYLTAGLLDSLESPDCSMEAAMVKVASSEVAWWSISECLQILGGLGYMKDYPFERYLRDSRIMMIFEGTNEILRLYISLVGCQHAGVKLHDVVRKLRNPFMNPGFIIKKILQRSQQKNDRVKLKMDLRGHVHPSLGVPAEWLEYSVTRLQYGVELVLARHGKVIVDHQMELRRLADVAIDVYAMTAVLARASRSYCIGLKYADHEVKIAGTFCGDAMKRVRENVKELEEGPYLNNDRNYQELASTIFKNKGYAAAHPLTRNWY